ncbi:hypothetical protein F5Y16DRAFT_198001 [Xylariaceae sp. FL0255]|nr:hypothetical protein F5Y16DRAFT_198001 [Xylariaceae sp. FL0255]
MEPSPAGNMDAGSSPDTGLNSGRRGAQHRYPSRNHCTECDTTYPYFKRLYAHVLESGHLSDRTCRICEKVFHTPNGLIMHQLLNQTHLQKVAAPTSSPRKTTGLAAPAPPLQTATPALQEHQGNTPAEAATKSQPKSQNRQPLDPTSVENANSPSKIMDRSPAGKSSQRTRERADRRREREREQEQPSQPLDLSWVSPAQPVGLLLGLLQDNLLTKEERKSRDFPIIEIRPKALTQTLEFSRQAFSSGSATKKRKGLVVDCEMVGTMPNPKGPQVSELVRLAVVDFFTGEVLLDNLVQPISHVVDWRFRYSGVNSKILNQAKQDPNTKVFYGWKQARAKIQELADDDTIFIGHALENDLQVLHLATNNVVDSVFITAHAAFGNRSMTTSSSSPSRLQPPTSISTRTPGAGGSSNDREKKSAKNPNNFGRSWGLKTLCKELLNLSIQKRSRQGHCCVEDALATRELILFCLLHPSELSAWVATLLCVTRLRVSRASRSNASPTRSANARSGKKRTKPPSRHSRRRWARRTLRNN